jgi:hypothetical protein
MRKLILKMNITLDGFVGGPNGEIDWIFKTMSEDAKRWTVDKVWQARTFNGAKDLRRHGCILAQLQ